MRLYALGCQWSGLIEPGHWCVEGRENLIMHGAGILWLLLGVALLLGGAMVLLIPGPV